MTTTNEQNAPDAIQHRRDAEYARQVLGKLKAAGMSEREIARRIGLSDRVLRQYKTGEQAMSYAVQFALEALAARVAAGHAVHEAAAVYNAGEVWKEFPEDPFRREDVGKVVACVGKHGEYFIGKLAIDGFSLFIETSQGIDAHRVPVQNVARYALLPAPDSLVTNTPTRE